MTDQNEGSRIDRWAKTKVPPKHPDGWSPGVDYDIKTGQGTVTLRCPFGDIPDPRKAFSEMLGSGPPIPVPLADLTFEPTQFRAWQQKAAGEWCQYWRFTISLEGGPEPWRQLIATLTAEAAKRKPARQLKAQKKPRLFVAMGDDQAPHFNGPLHEATCAALDDLAPDGFIYLGDGCDFDSLSSHAPDTAQAFVSTAQEVLDTAHQILADRVDAAGEQCTERVYLQGNHEDRIARRLVERLPELFGVKRANVGEAEAAVLSIENLLRLPSLGFEFQEHELGDYPHGTYQVAPGLIASHGWLVRKGAGNSARASVEHLNSGIVVGHTHRQAVSKITRWNPDGTHEVFDAVEAGAMCDPRGLQYTKYPDWQPGWLTVEVFPDGGHTVDLVTWDGSVLRWRDLRWEVTATGVRR